MQCFSWAQVVGFVLIALSAWVAFMAYKERRRWLLTWSSVYFATSVFMTLLTYIKGPDPHDMFGCRWVSCTPFFMFSVTWILITRLYAIQHMQLFVVARRSVCRNRLAAVG